MTYRFHCRYLPCHASYRTSETCLSLPPSTDVVTGPDSRYICEKCGSVEIFDVPSRHLKEWAHTVATWSFNWTTAEVFLDHATDLSLFVRRELHLDGSGSVLKDKSNSLLDKDILTVKLESCPLCYISPVKENWIPHFLDGEQNDYGLEWVGNLLGYIAKSRSLEFQFHGEVYACAYGTSGLLKRQPVLPLYDAALAKVWLGNCKQHHGAPCNQRSLPPKRMRLIDCKKQKVVKADPSWAWLALSYVWGQREPPGSHNSRWSKTVEDAMRVTTEIGYRYLWVDEYCIKQNDNVHKQEQIASMGHIYQGADLTLVAASADSKHDGIMGVSSERGHSNQTFNIPGRVMHISKDPIEDIRGTSTWWKRGWTFQEGLLSKRMLVFSKSEMTFYCQCTAWAESIGGLQHITKYQDAARWKALRYASSLFQHDFQDGAVRLPGHGASESVNEHRAQSSFMFDFEGEEKVSSTLKDFYSLVKLYTERRLTYDADTLHAFSGVLQTFQAQSRHLFVHYISGLPLFSSRTGVKEQNIAASLAWYHDSHENKSVPRKPGFPSWSWAAWKARASSTSIDSFDYNSRIYRVMFCSEERDFAPPYGEKDAQNQLDSVTAILFEAWAVPNSIISLAGRKKKFLEIQGIYTALYGADPSYCYEQLKAGSWGVLWLSQESQYHEWRDTTWYIDRFLVVEWKDGGVAERTGLLVLEEPEDFELEVKSIMSVKLV